MRKATDWRAADVEIVDEREFIRQPGDTNAKETIEKIAWLMDGAIPIGSYRIGLDPILGLIPGIGDVFTGLMSAMLIFHAHRAGIPKATVMRMVANVGIDSAVGAIPLVGDVFDFAWKANTRNLELYRSAVRGRRDTGRDWGFLALILLGLGLAVAIPILLVVWVLKAIF
jgi:hypothetical protein